VSSLTAGGLRLTQFRALKALEKLRGEYASRPQVQQARESKLQNIIWKFVKAKPWLPSYLRTGVEKGQKSTSLTCQICHQSTESKGRIFPLSIDFDSQWRCVECWEKGIKQEFKQVGRAPCPYSCTAARASPCLFALLTPHAASLTRPLWPRYRRWHQSTRQWATSDSDEDDEDAVRCSGDCGKLLDGTEAWVDFRLRMSADPTAYSWFCVACHQTHASRAPMEKDYAPRCHKCHSPQGEECHFFTGPNEETTTYCEGCWNGVKKERRAARHSNPIGHALVYNDIKSVIKHWHAGSKQAADAGEKFLLLHRAGLMAFLESELQPAFEAFKLEAAWKDYRPSVGGGTAKGEGASLWTVLAKAAEAGSSSSDAQLPEQAAADKGELDAGDSYADYVPAKLNYGAEHVEHIVETASLACVASADVTYVPQFPAELLTSGALSRVQLEVGSSQEK